MKTCATCGERKPLSQYTKRSASADGLHSSCRPCKNEGQRQYRNKPEGARQRKSWELRKRYGIDMKRFDQMMEEQDSKCPCCGDELEAPVVDHCHASGEVRGLLCSGCNLALGHARDNRGILYNMIEYLEEHKGCTKQC